MLSKFEPLTNSHAADDVIAFRIKDVIGVNVSGSFNDERLNATNQSLVCSHERGDTAVCTITEFKTTLVPSNRKQTYAEVMFGTKPRKRSELTSSELIVPLARPTTSGPSST